MTERAQALTSCPYCGLSEGEICSFALVKEEIAFWWRCKACKASGPPKSTEAEAIAAWNQRAGEASRTADLLPSPCLNCDTDPRECPNNCESYRLWDFGLQAAVEVQSLEAEIAELQEKLRLLEGIEDCIMEQDSQDFEQAMELNALRARLIATQDYRAKAEAEMDRLNGIVGKQNTELVPLRKLREACKALEENKLWSFDEKEPTEWANVLGTLAALDEASAPTET